MTQTLPRWDDAPAWRRIFAALPEPMRPPEPLSVQEEWRSHAGFDIHIDRWTAPGARARILMLHGGGGHGRLLGPLAWRLALHGFEVICPDLPGYGLTQCASKHAVRYGDWRAVAADIIKAERARGGALFVYGLSMGGMLAFDAVAETRAADGLIATCFLDPPLRAVRRSVVRWPFMASLIDPIFAITPAFLNGLPVPMALAGDMTSIANDRSVVRAIIDDKRAGGNWMPTGFLRTWLQSRPHVAPERFDVCPVLMAHPADDRWTDVAVSDGFYDRITTEKRRVLLENAGHFPIEAPGRDQLDHAITAFANAVIEKRPIPADLLR